MPEWKTEEELFALIKTELYTSVVGDLLDKHGRHHQFLPAEIRPITSEMIVVGWAMPVQQIGVSGIQEKPFGG